jgi:hypothetical protein
MDESSRSLIVRRSNVVVSRSSCAREGAFHRPAAGVLATDRQKLTAAVRSADFDQAIRTAQAATVRGHVRWRRSRDLEVYGRQHPRGCIREDGPSRLYDKVGRQSYREWARRRTQHKHARKSAALRERRRIMHTFFGRLPIDAPDRNLPSTGTV